MEGGLFLGVTNTTRFSNPSASQSSFFEQRGGDVAFAFTGGATAGARDGDAGFVFEVEFALDEATDFRLTGTGSAFNDAPRFGMCQGQ